MNNFIRFEIITRDRIGMTLDILRKIHKASVNLNSLEVFPKKVCIKMESLEEKKKELLKKDLYALEGVIAIEEIQLLSYETNERKLIAIIDAVEDGIMAINKNLEIEIFNRYCEGVFHCKKEDVLGRDIRELMVENTPIINLLKDGQEYDHIQFNIKNDQGEKQYLTTGRAIKDDHNKIFGGVVSIRDVKKVMEIANSISVKKEGAFKDIVGNSFLLERVKKLIMNVARSNSTILLRGESGTGKELFARAIQNLSNRRDENFVILNCAALPDNLIESELFGYEKGSFTGAIGSGKEGLFKEAHVGTLFLDEVGELSMAMQAKLLRVLQEGTIRKIGSTKEEKVDVRIISATNRNLEDMIKTKKFREDLYYRLNVIPIQIPPLRERLEDIPLLVTFFINELNKKLDKKIEGFELELINKFMKYNWPGNIRELQNVIERAMNLCEGNCLKLENLMVDDYKDSKKVKKSLDFEDGLKLKEIVAISEKRTILKALEKNKSLRKTAKILGVSHTTIMNKIKKYNIKCKI